MKTKQEIQDGLAQMYGTEGYTRWSPLFRNHVLTDGAKFLAESAEAYWLMDAIASRHSSCMKDDMLKDFQVWTLTVKDGSGTLICERDTGNVAFKQEIPFTDFPLDEIKLYCNPMGDGKHYVILLTSEY